MTNKKINLPDAARVKQLVLGLVMGLIVGAVLGALTGFWLWLAAGVTFGFAVGALTKPPERDAR
ncbi:hypothetical protein KJY78_03550 [Canibacter sp. lx-45]|uniref:hypothetical protein n=1 Tax=Canibacter zhuwentaonis TaxID=2837491 RepID=UPI001BDDA238|nr:hypothetical protein [Canibacter zhuwentaonis]MBT1035425.1 hypothetical protein [Canibacter zhuwentaonis]